MTESLEQPTEKPRGRTVADELRKRLNILVVLQVLTALALLGTVLYFAHKTAVATEALCNLRAQQVRTLRQGQQFLADHPNGGFGFNRGQIEAQLMESTKAIQALDALGCKSVPLTPGGKETP